MQLADYQPKQVVGPTSPPLHWFLVRFRISYQVLLITDPNVPDHYAPQTTVSYPPPCQITKPTVIVLLPIHVRSIDTFLSLQYLGPFFFFVICAAVLFVLYIY